jgi:hypothetical protein
MAKLIASTEILTQGTVVDNVNWGNPEDDYLGIVLSNPCDFENDKARYVLIAGLVPAANTIQASKEFKNKLENVPEGQTTLSKGKWEKVIDLFRKYVHNVDIGRYFFIDTSDAFDSPYLLVDFQRVITLPISERETLSIEGQLPSPYREKMIMHFSSYVARIGVDRIKDEDGLYQHLALPFTPPV